MEKTVYNGTNNDSAKQILKAQKFYPSIKSNEWAGHGIYFFGDNCLEQAKNNAYKWAKYIKKFQEKDIAILRTNIEFSSNQLLDFTDEEILRQYNEFKEEILGIIYRKHIVKKDEKAKNLASKLDCELINRFCEKNLYCIVKRSVYINFNKCPSTIPNCTIYCVRDSSVIKEICKED